MSRSEAKPQEKAWFFGLCWAAVAWLILRPFSNLGVDFHHQGHAFVAASEVAGGKALYREVYSHYGPLSTWLHAVILKAAGGRLIALQEFCVFTHALTAGLFAVLSRRWFDRRIASVLVAIWVCSTYTLFWSLIPWSSAYVLPLTMGSLLLAFSALERGSVGFAVLSGALLAAGVGFRQNLGISVVAAGLGGSLLFAFSWMGSKLEARLARGAVLGFFSGLAFLVATLEVQDSTLDFYLQGFRMVADFAGAFSWNPFHILKVIFFLDRRMLRWLLPFFVLFLVWLSRSRRIGDRAVAVGLVLISLAASCVLLFYYRRWLMSDRYYDDGIIPGLAAMGALALPLQAKWKLKGQGAETALLGLFAWGALLLNLPLNDPLHSWFSMPLPLLSLAVLAKNSGTRSSRLLVPLLIALFLPGFAVRAGLGIRRMSNHHSDEVSLLTLPPALRGMRETPSRARAWQATWEGVHSLQKKLPGAPVVVVGEDTLASVLLPGVERRRNFVLWRADLLGQLYPADLRELRAGLLRAPLIVVIGGTPYEEREAIARGMGWTIAVDAAPIRHAVLFASALSGAPGP